MTQFTIPSYTAESIATKPSMSSIRIKIVGFWSEPITVYIERDGQHKKWKTSISNSSGGRDTKVCDDITAYTNFANAMLAAVEVCKDVEQMSDDIEVHYQLLQEEYKKEEEIARAEHQKNIDADPAMGIELATQLVENAVNLCKSQKMHRWEVVSRDFGVYARGSEKPRLFTVKFGDRVSFKYRSGSIKKSELISTLSELSIRSLV